MSLSTILKIIQDEKVYVLILYSCNFIKEEMILPYIFFLEVFMIIFRKSGNFYQVFDDDAIILHSLFKYRIKDYRVGFPISSIDKVLEKLKEIHIDYKIGEEEIHFKDNNYNKILIDSKNKISLEYKINEIIDRINNSDYNTLNELIEVIDNFYNEKR